jgi:hypothetical protein
MDDLLGGKVAEVLESFGMIGIGVGVGVGVGVFVAVVIVGTSAFTASTPLVDAVTEILITAAADPDNFGTVEASGVGAGALESMARVEDGRDGSELVDVVGCS